MVVVVIVVIVEVVVVGVVVVVSMHASSLWFVKGWCWPAGQGGHDLCVVSLGTYKVSLSGHGMCVSHVYAFAVGVTLPPQLPALYL